MLLTRSGDSQPRTLDLTRRSLGALLLTGATLAAFPALAQASPPIHTPADGLIVGDVVIPQIGGPLPAYVARPDARGRFATVIVVSEIFGLHDYIRDVCRRLAQIGYVAIAPDYFHRAGDPSRTTDAAALQRIGEAATNAQVMDDTGAVLRWLADQRFTSRDVGVTGFSWGGAVVWMACDRFPEIRAGVSWYGRPMKPQSGFLSEEARLWPIDIAPRLRTPVLGLYAGLDQGIPRDDIETLREVLRRARANQSEIVVYPDVEHGFHADYRSSYDAAAAADGWGRMLDYFARHGVRPTRWRR
jgi:carboxymethylenebutenolidase